MISSRPVLREVPDPPGTKRRLHRLEAISGLILLLMPGGRKGMKAAFHPGRGLPRRQLDRSGVRRDRKSPCHATLSETSGVPDPEAMAAAFSRLTIGAPDAGDVEPCLRRIAIDGRTLRGSRDAGGKAGHVLSALCAAPEQSVGHTSSRGKGREIPDALRLPETIDPEGMVITGDAIFCRKAIPSRITEKGGDCLLPVKDNRIDLREVIETAFREPVFPLAEWQDPPRTGSETGHGRIDLRGIALLPADAPGEHMRTTWPPVRTIARIERQRGHVRAGHSVKTETETTYPVTSPGQPDPDDILRLNRRHWRIEAMHRDRDVTRAKMDTPTARDMPPVISSPSTAPRAHCPNASLARIIHDDMMRVV